MTLKEKIKGWKSSTNPAKLNLSNTWNVVKSWVITSDWYFNYFTPKHIREQIYYRALVSEDCLKNIFCRSCGCLQFQKIHLHVSCSLLYENQIPCYNRFLSKKDWKNLNLDKSIIEQGRKIYQYYKQNKK